MLMTDISHFEYADNRFINGVPEGCTEGFTEVKVDSFVKEKYDFGLGYLAFLHARIVCT